MQMRFCNNLFLGVKTYSWGTCWNLTLMAQIMQALIWLGVDSKIKIAA